MKVEKAEVRYYVSEEKAREFALASGDILWSKKSKYVPPLFIIIPIYEAMKVFLGRKMFEWKGKLIVPFEQGFRWFNPIRTGENLIVIGKFKKMQRMKQACINFVIKTEKEKKAEGRIKIKEWTGGKK
jgi:hypothetical protein